MEQKKSLQTSKKWIGENWKILAVIIAIIAVGSAFYFLKQPQVEQPNQEQKQEQAAELKDETLNQAKAAEEEKPQEQGKVATTSTEDSITQKALRAEGVTHLARRALKEYEEKFGKDETLTKEHRIYIEDFLKRRTGRQPLEIGQELLFKVDLIKEAIEKSKLLKPKQLENLKHFSAKVKNL